MWSVACARMCLDTHSAKISDKSSSLMQATCGIHTLWTWTSSHLASSVITIRCWWRELEHHWFACIGKQLQHNSTSIGTMRSPSSSSSTSLRMWSRLNSVALNLISRLPTCVTSLIVPEIPESPNSDNDSRISRYSNKMRLPRGMFPRTSQLKSSFLTLAQQSVSVTL